MDDAGATRASTIARHERDLLGVLLILGEHGELRLSRLDALRPAHFVSPHAGATFQQLRELLKRDDRIDRHVLVSELVSRHRARRAEALEDLNALVADAPPQPHLTERIRRVRDAAARREASRGT